MRELRDALDRLSRQSRRIGLETNGLMQLGALRRALLDALEATEIELRPAIVRGWEDAGLTYVELANASGFSSVTTITKIMREMGASPGIGARSSEKPRRRSRR